MPIAPEVNVDAGLSGFFTNQTGNVADRLSWRDANRHVINALSLLA